MARFSLRNDDIMRTLLAVVIIASTAAAAQAGIYAGVGIGTGASVSDSNNTSYTADGRSARLALGYRIGPFSVEGAYSGYGLQLDNAGLYDSRSLQLAGKYNLELGSKFEAYGRLGFLRTDLNARDASNSNLSGTGYTMSVGMEYRIDLIATGLGIFMDWTRSSADLSTDLSTGSTAKFGEQTASMWTLGVNVSL
ncbi:MAG: outer membrane beta-barrel protein [Kofleriaceae bacterium]